MICSKNFTALMIKCSQIQPNKAPNFQDYFVVNFWYQEFKSYTEHQLMTALSQCLKGRSFPCIADLKAALGDVNLDEDAKARDAVKRIDSAIRKFGYMGWDEAKPYIGTLGEHLVQVSGGWDQLCSVESEHEHSIRMAQLREYAKVAIIKAEAGHLNVAPELINKEKPNGQYLELVKDLSDVLSINLDNNPF